MVLMNYQINRIYNTINCAIQVITLLKISRKERTKKYFYNQFRNNVCSQPIYTSFVKSAKFKQNVLDLLNFLDAFRSTYLAAKDPLCRDDWEMGKVDIMLIFMLINQLPPALIAAWYLEGGQSVDDVIKIEEFYRKMKILFEKEKQNDNNVIGLFGTKFAIHLETRQLMRVDMTVIHPMKVSNEPFIPDTLNWKRQRAIRELIRKGEYKVTDFQQLQEVKNAWKNGLRLRGNNNKKSKK